jgi:hypothetical protein
MRAELNRGGFYPRQTAHPWNNRCFATLMTNNGADLERTRKSITPQLGQD